MMRTIGAISDTPGLQRPQALAALAGCDPIIHAGDVGSPDVLARLGALAPVHAVRGNVDHGAWSANLPVTQRIEIDGFRIYVLHILAELDPQGMRAPWNVGPSKVFQVIEISLRAHYAKQIEPPGVPDGSARRGYQKWTSRKASPASPARMHRMMYFDNHGARLAIWQ